MEFCPNCKRTNTLRNGSLCAKCIESKYGYKDENGVMDKMKCKNPENMDGPPIEKVQTRNNKWMFPYVCYIHNYETKTPEERRKGIDELKAAKEKNLIITTKSRKLAEKKK
eukprot:870555_1